MNTKLVDDIASAVLYEGYLLYPYRASAIKNKQRWNFGVLYPREYAEKQSGADAWKMQTECLVTTDSGSMAQLEVRVRFLHLVAQGAVERELELPAVELSDLAVQSVRHDFVEAAVELEAKEVAERVFRIRTTILNTSTDVASSRDEALLRSLVSTHTILNIRGGEFVSLLEPPEHLRELTSACENLGAWPVLVGEPGQRDCMLSSPIILYDYPQIAPESPGALFDGTEIDEILSLRILTLTDEEKLEMATGDERARQILERTESMPQEQFMKMHGVLKARS
jgi:hydrogenase maturation protease